MSKSEISDFSRINLTDDKDQIINKIKNKRKEILAGWFWGFVWRSRRLKFNLVTTGRNLSNCEEGR